MSFSKTMKKVLTAMLKILNISTKSKKKKKPSTNSQVKKTSAQTKDPVSAIFGPVTPNYSPTNKAGRAAEIREAEMQEIKNSLKK